MAGQTINDRLLAARHSLAGQGLAKSVCKATTEEMIAPKKKHLDYLVHCTNEPNVSIPHLANLLIERSQNTNWVVVYKALITVHHLLAYGNERFMQYLASSNSTFNLSNFLDKGGVQELLKQSITLNRGPSDFAGAVGSRIGYDMSPFIRRYAKYLNEKALSYRTVAFDFCKVKRGKEEGSLRTMNADKLLKTLPVLQAQLDGLLEFDCSANDLTNGVINMCFMLLFRDLIRLFACYNDGIINLLEKYFDMNKKQCRDALDLYKKFLVRMDRVGEFLKVAENVGIDKGDIPDLTKAPSSLLDALEQHLATLEGRKGSAANTPTQSASNQKNVKSGVSALSSTSSSFGTAAASTRFDTHANGIDETIKAQALAEEEAAMNQYKSKVSSPTSSAGGALTNPFLSSPPATQANASIVDLFGSPGESQPGDAANTANTKASDDLLQLGNPFADMFGAPTPAPGGAAATATTGANNIWMSNGFNGVGAAQAAPAPAGITATNTFVSESNFSSVFGSTEPTTKKEDVPNPFLDADELIQVQGQEIKIEQSAQMQSFMSSQLPEQQSQSFLIAQQQQSQQFSGESRKEPQQEKHPIKSSQKTAITPLTNAAASAYVPMRPVKQPPNRPPPSRPPPPKIDRNISSSTAKSALDELNETIKMALSSPVKSCSSGEAVPVKNLTEINAPLIPSFPQHPESMKFSQQQLQQQQQLMQQMPTQHNPSSAIMGIASGFGTQPQQVLITSSPARQPLIGGGVLQQQQQQMGQPQQQQPQSTGKILTGDLDSSLASLVDNLNINKSSTGKGVQWNSPKNTAKPGTNWTPQPMAATTGVGYRPMAQGMTVSPAPSTISPFVHASYPVLSNYIQQGIPQMQPVMGASKVGGVPMMASTGMMAMGAPGQTGMPGMMASGQPAAGMMMTGAVPTAAPTGAAATVPPAQNGNKAVQLDPFGAL